jgi:hypothetical protein
MALLMELMGLMFFTIGSIWFFSYVVVRLIVFLSE